MMPASTTKWDDLLLESKLDSFQLNKITPQIDLVVMAIAALTQIDRGNLSQIAQELELAPILSNWINEWPSGRSSTQQPLDLEQLRSLVIVANYLAIQHQSLVRQNISDWHQLIESDRLPLQSPPLAEYIENFITIYQARYGREPNQSFEALSAVALNLLIELLFCGSPNGHQRLWRALHQRSH